MPRYEGYECPVCKKLFEEGDDVVYCPECGTPHHRECYNLVGKCVNSGLHSSGFEFDTKPIDTKADDSNTQVNVIGQYYAPNMNNDENNEADPQPSVININFNPNAEYERSNETINGNAIADVAATVRTNIPRFVTRFRDMEKKNSKTGWNWSAFFFGSLYFLFRKMYKQGISLLCVTTALFIGSEAMIYKFAPKYIEAVQSIASQYANRESFDPNVLLTSDYGTAAKIVYATLGILVVIRIIEALFADYLYMNSVAEIIDKMKKQLDENMSFSVSPLMGAENNLSQEQMRRMYLARRGGVSFFAPLTAILVVQMLLQFL